MVKKDIRIILNKKQYLICKHRSQCYLDERSGGIRIFGFGLSFRNIKKSGYELTFSQRHGYNKYVKIFGYVITFLKR